MQHRENDLDDALYDDKIDAEERVYNEKIDAEERAQKQAAQEPQPELSLGHIVRYPGEVLSTGTTEGCPADGEGSESCSDEDTPNHS